MQDVALGWLILELTDSPFYLGLADFARFLPLLFFPPLGGILADREDRRKLLLISVATAAAITVALATFVRLGHIRAWHVLILVFLLGSVFSIYFTIRQSIIPNLVDREDLLNALSLDFAGASIVRILGPSLAGVLISLVGAAYCFYLQVVGYLAALFMFLRLGPQFSGSVVDKTNAWQNFRQQWCYIRQNRTVFDLMVLSAVLIPFGMSYRVLMPVFARDVLAVGPSGLGMLMGASGAGAVASTLSLAMVRDFRHRGLMVLLGALLFGIALILFSLSRRFLPSLLLLGVGEGMGAMYQTTNNVLLQTMVPDALRGRITGMYILVWGLLPFGSLWMGTIADLVGAPLAIGFGGAVCALFSIGWGVIRPDLRRLN
jgi:MFS family permease